MSMFSRLVTRRLRVLIGAFLLLACTGLCANFFNLHSSFRAQNHPSTAGADLEKTSVVSARTSFARPLFHNWAAPKKAGEVDVERNCRRYWGQLMALPDQRLSSPRPGFVLEPRIYKKSRWMIGAKKALRKKLRDEGQERALADADLAELEARFHAETRLVSVLESHFVDQITHLRVLGKCFWSPGAQMAVDVEHRRAMGVISRLLPWLKEPVDVFGSFPGASKSSQGIVIPVFSSTQVSTQIDRIARLVRVLRAQGNMLPIQVVYADAEIVSAERQTYLKGVATADDLKMYGLAFEQAGLDGSGASPRYPKQSLSFLDVSQFIMPDVPISDNLVYFVGVLLSDFVNAVVMTSHTIPMAENLASLFDSTRYQRQGFYFFKDRPSLDSRPEPFPYGFFEVNELVNDHAAASPEEMAFFGLRRSSNPHTRRVTELGFSRLLDPSMVLVNKQRAMAGLILSSVLSSHSVLDPKYNTLSGFNPEFLWLGQELAATQDFVDFNSYFASVPGVLTPRENLSPLSVSAELCSSSWSQISDEDESLVFVTSHQLENSVLPSFAAAVRSKYVVPSATGDTGQVDDSLAKETIDKSFLFVKSVLQPVFIDGPQINDEGQPIVSIENAAGFGGINNHWCAYDIVGSANPPDRGLVYNYREKDQRRFLFYLTVWKQVPDNV